MNRPPDSQRTRQAAWLVGGIFVVAGAAALIIQAVSEPAPTSPTAELAQKQSTDLSARSDEPHGDRRASTLGDLWRLIKAPETDERRVPQTAESTAVPADAPFTAQGVREGLKAVRLDDNGDLILDHTALLALDRSLQNGDLRLTDQELSDLQQMIRDRLPGKAGAQTARIVADYYRYRQAETEYLSTTTPQESAVDPASISAHKARYDRLRQLREQYLGPEASEKLFRVSDAHATYMFEAHRIRNDDSLSDEEKIRRVNALNDELQQQYITIDNWEQRYQQFQADKQQILQAGLSDADKVSQIKGLLNEQFTAEELRQVEHLELDKL